MIRRPPRSTQSRSSAASDVYKRQMSPSTSRASTRSARSARSTTWPGTSRSCSPAPGTPRCRWSPGRPTTAWRSPAAAWPPARSPGDLMRITAAQLPEPPDGADRIIVTRSAVAVLDGASAFESASVPPGEYASHLGASIAAALNDRPDAPLASVLAEAIAATASMLGLAGGGGGPSSTVAMARLAGGTLDLLALGDSCIFYGTGPGGPGTGTLTDGRLAGLR